MNETEEVRNIIESFGFDTYIENNKIYIEDTKVHLNLETIQDLLALHKINVVNEAVDLLLGYVNFWHNVMNVHYTIKIYPKNKTKLFLDNLNQVEINYDY